MVARRRGFGGDLWYDYGGWNWCRYRGTVTRYEFVRRPLEETSAVRLVVVVVVAV